MGCICYGLKHDQRPVKGAGFAAAGTADLVCLRCAAPVFCQLIYVGYHGYIFLII
jgi:hypothetical protein